MPGSSHAATEPTERQELRTQVARALGLQSRFTEGHGMLDALDLNDPLVALHSNRGWARFDAGDIAGALEAFTAAKDAAETYGTEQQRVWADEAIEEARAAS